MSISQAMGAAAAMIASVTLATACHAASRAPQPDSEARRESRGGGEAWHATTRAPIRQSQGMSWVTVDEDVELDATGRLTMAVLRVRDDTGSPQVHVTFDVSARRVAVERGGRHDEWCVPGDEPWILEPVRGPGGRAIPTPLVAWTTYRATRRSEWVRLVRPLAQQTLVVPRDQHVVDTTVLLGDEAVEVDDSFVRRMPIGDVELARGFGSTPFRFREAAIVRPIEKT